MTAVRATVIPNPDPQVWDNLCLTCRHMRRVETKRGSGFVMCERSKIDAAYPKYPPQPIIDCPGHEADEES